MSSLEYTLPTWEEFESLFLEPDTRTILLRDLYHRHEIIREALDEADISEYGEAPMENEEYREYYCELFTFGAHWKYTLIGALTETFTDILGEDNLQCDIDWEQQAPGMPFTIRYKGLTAQCQESGDDDENYVEGINILAQLMLKKGLVLKTPIQAGLSSDISFTIIPLEIWNRGLKKFGLETLRAQFIDFGDTKMWDDLVADNLKAVTFRVTDRNPFPAYASSSSTASSTEDDYPPKTPEVTTPKRPIKMAIMIVISIALIWLLLAIWLYPDRFF